MIKFIKNDFRSVREGLNYLTGRRIPLGIAVLWYVGIGLILLPLMPFIWIYYKVRIRMLKRGLETWVNEWKA